MSDDAQQVEEIGFLDLNLEAVPDTEVLPPDEYLLRIVKVVVKPYVGTKDGNNHVGVRVMCKAPEYPNAELITGFYTVPDSAHDEQATLFMNRLLKSFYECFGIQTSGQVDVGDMAGKEGWCFVEVKNDPTYGEQNNIKRCLAPRE